MKRKLCKKSFRSAHGIDAVSYSKILTIPNDALVELFNTSLDKCDASQRWLVTILIGILKQGRAVDDSESYRLVGLECCLLKVLTMLFDDRLREWAATKNIIPDMQNSFRLGYRTDDNCLSSFAPLPELARKGSRFGRLWVDMYAAGVGGPFFDWIRMVYACMVYAMKFRLWEHPDDVRLHGHAVSQAEQAGDNIIMSTLFAGLQAKVNTFFKWCANKRVFVSASKSKWMIFGPLPRVILSLRLGSLVVKLVHEFKYVGVWLTSTISNIFSRNCTIKGSKAQNASNAIFAMKHRIGSLPVKEGLQLYMARVDCYLISAAEISIDVDAHLLDEYLDAQYLFLWRLLGINSHSMLAVLFTETGLMPIRIQRLLLALSRLRYMVGLEDIRRGALGTA
ncbi:Reverse transcriptase domain-containing protein [Mycena venus]|uniref:Reverse transcriptase domain-containing protein n=1 Tax=Mycena venus TaxID=2733690 RepID=A0A8H7D3F7_9AGAR|nr:Reverse transcriptase domain-containing protein [Mycena venus]